MTEDDVEFGDDLRTLFAGDRLAVTPAPGAARLIVAGALRRRRRRAAALVAVVSAVAVLAATGVYLTSWAQPDAEIPMAAPPSSSSAVPPTATTATTTATDVKTRVRGTTAPGVPTTRTVVVSGSATVVTLLPGQAPPQTTTVADGSTPPQTESTRPPVTFRVTLGPGGYQNRLWLGMTFEEVQDSGMLADPQAAPPESGSCATYELAEGTADVRHITLSADLGLSMFTAGGARSPEGIGIGSIRGDVAKTYPDGEGGEKGYTVATGSHDGVYVFMFNGPAADAEVAAFYLVLDGQTCDPTP